ncbi:MAG TPA: diheme cytochrome c precursor [Myxococcota bacterium]|nr:diheme cytochrome c precursor [Myxococcota bacterium]HND28952.1 diheme cytochrome c precursor [Myxococcota bacterium]
MEDHPNTPLRMLALPALLAVLLAGFLLGTRDESYQTPPPSSEETAELPTEGKPALRYLELQYRPAGTSSGWEADLARLRGNSRLDPVAISGSKAEDLAKRAERRAYDGAPPTIPHPFAQASAAECLTCHEKGMQLRGFRAPEISHAVYENCAQCHAGMVAPFDGIAAPDADRIGNTFVGNPAPQAGERAWSIAPPTIPHRTLMRENCISCHGPNGSAAMRASHPDRENCVQCHGTSAALDQRPWQAP